MNKYSWDLEHLLQNKPLEDLHKEWLNKQEEIMKLYKGFLKTENNFIEFLNKSEELEKISNRLYNFISNNLNEDIANPTWNNWTQKLSNESMKFSTELSDYTNVVLENQELILGYLKNPKISEYKRSFDLIFKTKKHVLSKEEEKLLTKLSIYDSGFEDVYSTLLDNDIKFESALDSNNKLHELKTQSDVFRNLKSKDRELRKNSWINFNKGIYKFKDTLTKLLYYNYLMLNTNSKISNFDDYVSSTAFSDEINKEFINTVYKQVKNFADIYRTYLDSRNDYLKELLNLKEIEPWDSSVDLYKKEIKYTQEETKEEALKALSILGEDYSKQVKRSFEERWISWMPKPGKQTGAYSIGGTKGLDKYYISMNFCGTIQSVYTLVHELGHSMNSYYFGQKQEIYQGCSIFYAEVSSIINEMLLNHHLLNKFSNDDEMKLMILDEMISGFFATTSRQVIFSNFEMIANEKINNSENFDYSVIEETYYNLSKEYTNSKKEFKDLKFPNKYSLVTPLRISHFFVGNFYVYKYAIGQVAAIIASERIFNNKEGSKDLLFKFLSSGNSLSPLETIKLLDIDLEKEETWLEAKEIVSKWISEFQQISEKLRKK